MYLPGDKVTRCIELAREITEQYRLYAHCDRSNAKSIDELVRICGEYLEKKINVYYFEAPAGSAIRGVFMEVNGAFEIYIASPLPRDLTRFVLCKEIFHVLLDEESCRNGSVQEHVEQMVASFTECESIPTSPVAWEALAEIAAAEFMFPHEDRLRIYGLTNVDCADAARRYEIPRAVADKFLSDYVIEYINGHLDGRVGIAA